METNDKPKEPKTDESEAIASFNEKFQTLRQEIHKIVIGQEQVIDRMLIALFSQGHALIIVLLLMFAGLSCTKINDSNQGTHKDAYGAMPQSKITADTSKVLDAIDLAIPALYNDKMTQSYDSKLYVLTSVQQIIINNKWIWRVTFKPKELIPDDLSKGFIGLGGEVFVNVDLSTKTTEITYGE